MKKVLFILPSLRPGGAERVLSFISQNLDKAKYDVTLLVIGFQRDAVYEVTQCNLVFLEKKRLLTALVSLFQFILKTKPNIVFSSITHVNLFMGFLAGFFKTTKFIAREASVISVMSSYSKGSSKYLRWIKRYYGNFSKIICQSNDMRNDINLNYGIPLNQLIVINNPITQVKPVKTKRYINGDVIQFVTVGRLSEEKGYSRIIKALSKIENYDFQYTIIGDGPLKTELTTLIHKLNLEKKISFISYTNKVSEVLSEKDVFLQSSYVEGFPNAVLESCVVGTPVLAFNSVGGTKEIISNNINGYIATDDIDFLNMLNNIHKLLALEPEKVSSYAFQKFSEEKIVEKYEKLFDSV